MMRVGLMATVWEDRTMALRYPVHMAAVALAMVALASVQLAQDIGFFHAMVTWPYYQLLYEIHDVLALGLALYVAYKWLPSMATAGILLHLVMMTPYLAVQFPEHYPEAFRLLLVTLIALFGIRLIVELRQAGEMTQQRERELSAMANLNARVHNERIQYLEKATKRDGEMARLHQAMAMACDIGAPMEVATELLRLVQDEVGAEYGTFTLVREDGTLGGRVDNFRDMEPFAVNSKKGGLAQAVLGSRESQYVADSQVDPRANSELVAHGIRSYLGLPVKAGEHLAGILFLHSTRPHAFMEEIEFLGSISEVMAGCLLRAGGNQTAEKTLA